MSEPKLPIIGKIDYLGPSSPPKFDPQETPRRMEATDDPKVKELEEQVAHKDKLLKTACHERAEDDTMIRDAVKKAEPAIDTEGDSYEVPDMATLAVDLAQRYERLKTIAEAAAVFVSKLALVHSDPAYLGVWSLALVHGAVYRGPKYGEELKALQAALDRPVPPPPR